MDFNFDITIIGSLPYEDPKKAVDMVFEHLSDGIPAWPQLPKRNFREQMYVQYAEGLPCLKLDDQQKKIWVDTSSGFIEGQEAFYRAFLDNDLEYFAIGREHASGLYEFIDRLGADAHRKHRLLKGHVTGPVSFGLGVLDENGRSILYNEEMHQILVKLLSMKAKWQIDKLRPFCEGIIIFIDEPYLVSIGSSFVSLDRARVIADLNEVIDSIKAQGALAGIHCCGNTDWSLLAETNTDIINFDAYDCAETLALYPDSLKEYINRGGNIAWGIVPTGEAVEGEDAKSLCDRLLSGINVLCDKGLDKKSIMDRALITPSCGMGSLTEEHTSKCLSLLSELPALLK